MTVLWAVPQYRPHCRRCARPWAAQRSPGPSSHAARPAPLQGLARAKSLCIARLPSSGPWGRAMGVPGRYSSAAAAIAAARRAPLPPRAPAAAAGCHRRAAPAAAAGSVDAIGGVARRRRRRRHAGRDPGAPHVAAAQLRRVWCVGCGGSGPRAVVC